MRLGSPNGRAATALILWCLMAIPTAAATLVEPLRTVIGGSLTRDGTRDLNPIAGDFGARTLAATNEPQP